ncbi:hypothetical protein [Caballeronia sp. dw_276]|uniref:hypothetical protein n=1 Tax=Caballeronia sp. dw_276 TaxID=2719795 RepID=UPI001BD23282|nr:hypothetical protein [Caballeronia sp. dw_276]
MPDLFFVSRHTHLQTATEIPPGGWARGYDDYTVKRLNGGDPWWIVIEQAIELERLRINPQLPSRWKASFLFTSLEDAMRTATPKYWGKQQLLLWSAEICDPSAPRHIGDADLFRDFEGLSYPQVCERAKAYWSTDAAHEYRELITESPIRITQPRFFWAGQGWQSVVIGQPPQ